jgi:transposase-like protein
MKKQRFICKKCGFKFEELIFEHGEAKEKKQHASPVICKRCGSPDVERL